MSATHETSSFESAHIPVPRQVAVAVAYRFITSSDHVQPRVEYLIVSSRKHPASWVLPKGGVEANEISDHGSAALREAWEEGGIRGKVVDRLHESTDPKAHRAVTKLKIFIPRAEYSFWLIRVDEDQMGLDSASWPEKHERERRWVGREEAIELVRWREDGAVDALMKVDETALVHSSP
ncbi:hypothetical protein PCASD_05156 [Puccinia coronata f. sp. avenae]|uniref:Nudix hydrolase domain-containing protein n=1 Tax=Puccinia coronata f. sp. avenae TaxID=200324 RepID=A0A2N5V3N2_9BASI|nr:hypothetical protein PCASD_05156 [Puccinia coronata f. sp. avenae]